MYLLPYSWIQRKLAKFFRPRDSYSNNYIKFFYIWVILNYLRALLVRTSAPFLFDELKLQRSRTTLIKNARLQFH